MIDEPSLIAEVINPHKKKTHMTPQPQQEYIITEMELQKISWNFTNRKFLDKIRSRPAPSAQWTDDEVMKQIEDAFDRGIAAAEATIDIKRHDATIRNQTLDEAITECEWDHPITQEDVWRKLESLRSTEAQQ